MFHKMPISVDMNTSTVPNSLSTTGPDGQFAPRLADNDCLAVDFLLDAGSSDWAERLTTPMVCNSFMERVGVAKRLFDVLETLPAEEPSQGLIEATMRRISTPQGGSTAAAR